MVDYRKNEWKNSGEANAIPLSATNLNKIEKGIEDCMLDINPLHSHWWRKSECTGANISESHVTEIETGIKTNTTIYYSKTISIKTDESGKVYAELDNPSEFTYAYNSYYNNKRIVGIVFGSGNYFMIGDTSKNSGFIYKTQENAIEIRITRVGDDGDSIKFYNNGGGDVDTSIVYLDPVYEIVEYVNSFDIEKYPTGQVGNFKYDYLGIPFKNARESVKIITGSYTGNNTLKRKINLGVTPCVVILTNNNGSCKALINDFTLDSDIQENGFYVTRFSNNDMGYRYDYIAII